MATTKTAPKATAKGNGDAFTFTVTESEETIKRTAGRQALPNPLADAVATAAQNKGKTYELPLPADTSKHEAFVKDVRTFLTRAARLNDVTVRMIVKPTKVVFLATDKIVKAKKNNQPSS